MEIYAHQLNSSGETTHLGTCITNNPAPTSCFSFQSLSLIVSTNASSHYHFKHIMNFSYGFLNFKRFFHRIREFVFYNLLPRSKYQCQKRSCCSVEKSLSRPALFATLETRDVRRPQLSQASYFFNRKLLLSSPCNYVLRCLWSAQRWRMRVR